MNKNCYLDHASTAPIYPDVVQEMVLYSNELKGNPSSLHEEGRKAKRILEQARRCVAELLGVIPEQIVFCSGATEANNAVLWQSVLATDWNNKRVALSSIEHDASINTCRFLEERFGVETDLIEVESNGRLNMESYRNALAENPSLVSVMTVNNEVGVVQDIVRIAEMAKEAGARFHTDAVQALPYLEVDFSPSMDFMSLSGHKIHGPKGVGVLLLRSRADFVSLLHGGGQEGGKRAGTEDIAAIAGFAKALEINETNKKMRYFALQELKRHAMHRLYSTFPDIKMLTDAKHSVPGILAFAFPNLKNEKVLTMLDMHGICASGGSACHAGSMQTSHVLQAMNVEEAYSNGLVRISFSDENKKEEIDHMIEVLQKLNHKR